MCACVNETEPCPDQLYDLGPPTFCRHRFLPLQRRVIIATAERWANDMGVPVYLALDCSKTLTGLSWSWLLPPVSFLIPGHCQGTNCCRRQAGQKESDLKTTPHDHHSELRVCEFLEFVSTEEAHSFQATQKPWVFIASLAAQLERCGISQ